MSASNVATVEMVRKYMAQLQKESKVGHALRRLCRLNLTLPVMTETGVGKAVNVFVGHPEHSQLALDLIDKIISVAAAARGMVVDAPQPSRKRPADDTMAEELTEASGMSADSLKACDAPPPSKKQKVVSELTPSATASASTTTMSTAPEETDELFVIERTHTRSMVYSGRQKAADVNASNKPTIAALLRAPSNATFEEAESILQHCTVEQLERVELLNPRWQRQTEIIWRKLCLQKFPDATARDTFSWRLSYQMRMKQQEDRLAAITSRISSNFVAQPKSAVPLIPVIQKKERQAATSTRVPLAPVNGSYPSPNQQPTSSSRTAASAKRPAPLMAKAIKMMNSRNRR